MAEQASVFKRWLPWLLIAVVLAIAIWVVFTLRPVVSTTDDQHSPTSPMAENSPVNGASNPTLAQTISTDQLPANTQLKGQLPTLAPSLQGTDIDCPLEVGQQEELVLTGGIRTCFDYFLSSVGEKTETQLVADITQYLNATLPKTAAAYGIKLLGQYMDYKHAEQRFEGQANGNDPQKLQSLLSSVMQLRRQYFTQPEANALFGREETFNQYTIKQMQIHNNPNLSSTQKAAQLAALLNTLPADLAENIRTSSQYANLQQLTQDMKSSNASTAEVQAMRTQLVGSAAAQRLGKLDTERAAWRGRVDSYLANRQNLINSLPAGDDRTRAIVSLRERTFSEASERTRATAYEAMYDRGEPLPN
jgi:lipase chaperone LimK